MQLYSKRRSVCIAQDGLPVFDDVGNIHGYAAFLKCISRDCYIDKSRLMGELLSRTGTKVKKSKKELQCVWSNEVDRTRFSLMSADGEEWTCLV